MHNAGELKIAVQVCTKLRHASPLTCLWDYILQIIASAGAGIVPCSNGVCLEIFCGMMEEGVKLDVLVTHNVRIGGYPLLVILHHLTETCMLD